MGVAFKGNICKGIKSVFLDLYLPQLRMAGRNEQYNFGTQRLIIFVADENLICHR